MANILQRLAGAHTVEKAEQETYPVMLPTKGPSAFQYSPRGMEYQYGLDIPGDNHPGTLGITYETLLRMARIPVVNAIIETRVKQCVDYARPQPSPYDNGFRVRMRERGKSPSRAALKSMEELQTIIMQAGREFQPHTGGFEAFVGATVRDSLTYDQANFEVFFSRYKKNGEGKSLPAGFVYVDPSTIRRARPNPKDLKVGRWDPEGVSFVQLIEDEVVQEFTQREMCFGVRNARSWEYSIGYGAPELEILVPTITSLINAETWNAVKFTTGINPDVFLTLKSGMSAEIFRAFERSVLAKMSGTANMRRVPILQLDPDSNEELTIHRLGRDSKEMEYSNWINWLMKVCCSVYQMDPAELSFVFGNEGQKQSLQAAGPTQRIAASQERGLKPLLRNLAGWLNRMVVWQWDPDFIFEFVGFDAHSASEKLKMDEKAVKSYKSPNEVRAESDLPPLTYELPNGANMMDYPIDAALVNVMFQASQLEVQMDMAEEGEEDAEDAPPEEDTAVEQSMGHGPHCGPNCGHVHKGHEWGDVKGTDDLMKKVEANFSARTKRLADSLKGLTESL